MSMIDCLDFYNKNGFIYPVDIFSDSEKDYLRSSLFNSIQKYNLTNSEYRCKSHMLFKWVDYMVFHPRVIELVKTVLGENIICIDTMFWHKKPHTDNFVSWHQDGYYWNADRNFKGLILWVPFQDCNADNGSLVYLPESHKSGFREHNDVKDDKNLLRRGQTADISNLDQKHYVCDIRYGQVTAHHPCNVHGSFPNLSSNDRLACNIQFISADCNTVIKDYKEYGVLVNGTNLSDIVCVDRPRESFEDNLEVWNTAWHNQRQNYLQNKGKIWT